jgi:hypothetical protein
MEDLESKYLEIAAGKAPAIIKNECQTVPKNEENSSENESNLLNLIAEIVVENIVRKLRNEHKK